MSNAIHLISLSLPFSSAINLNNSLRGCSVILGTVNVRNKIVAVCSRRRLCTRSHSPTGFKAVSCNVLFKVSFA